MLPALLSLGTIPARVNTLVWLVSKLGAVAKPLLENPGGVLQRVGDALVWNGGNGQKVLAGLESLSESQARIEGAVNHIEAAQIAVAGGLSTLTHLSMLSLGVTAFAAGFMLRRLNALQQRLTALDSLLGDVHAYAVAQAKAPLEASLDALARHEQKQQDKDLDTALAQSNHAAHVYCDLVQREAHGAKHLPVLNQCGRCYLLALLTELRCLVLADNLVEAERRSVNEKPTLTQLARVTFDEVLGKSPEVYLDANFQPDNVTLDLLAEVYQQAHVAGAVGNTQIRDAGQLFEQLRPNIFARKSRIFHPAGRAKTALLTKLKYLIACLEEVNRVEALRLRIEAAREGNYRLQDLEREVAALHGGGAGAAEPRVVAYALS